MDVVNAGVERGHAFVVLADTILYPEGGASPPTVAGLRGSRWRMCAAWKG